MTDNLFWLGISIPTVTALMGIFLNMNGLNRLGSRIGVLENRVGVLENRFGVLENRFGILETRITGLESRFGGIETRLQVIEGDLRRFYQIIGEHSARLDNLEKG